jgi:hypothetical protein
MPRPANGYKNAAGQPVPGTHDPISRFMDQTALKHWAYKRGQEGLPLYDLAAIDIGSTVHGMAELDLQGRPDREIEAYANDRLVAPDHLRKAWTSFGQFRAWREQCRVRAIAQETSLVSERYQYGGTPDTIAIIGNGLGIIDFKTSAKPYPDHWLGLAAHGNLWQETQRQSLDTYHLLILPKDGAPFQHHVRTDLLQQWKLFLLYLEAYQLERQCNAAPPRQPKAGVAAKPRVRVKAHTAPALSLAETLRAYGHVPEARP